MPLTIACSPISSLEIFITIIILLISTIIIEAILLKNILKKNWGESFEFCSIANVASSIAGIIFAFSVFAITSSFGHINDIIGMICWILTLAVLIYVENAIARKYWKYIPKKKLFKAVIIVNIVTYIILSIFIFIMPEHGRPRKKARRISCTSNLKQIGLSLTQYAMDNENFFPNEGWEQLRSNDYLTDYGVYNCPSSDTPKGNDNQKLTDEIVDYVYKKGLKDSDDSKIPLAWDKPGIHEDYGNVLFLDGHVKGFAGADWMEQAGIIKK